MLGGRARPGPRPPAPAPSFRPGAGRLLPPPSAEKKRPRRVSGTRPARGGGRPRLPPPARRVSPRRPPWAGWLGGRASASSRPPGGRLRPRRPPPSPAPLPGVSPPPATRRHGPSVSPREASVVSRPRAPRPTAPTPCPRPGPPLTAAAPRPPWRGAWDAGVRGSRGWEGTGGGRRSGVGGPGPDAGGASARPADVVAGGAPGGVVWWWWGGARNRWRRWRGGPAPSRAGSAEVFPGEWWRGGAVGVEARGVPRSGWRPEPAGPLRPSALHPPPSPGT